MICLRGKTNHAVSSHGYYRAGIEGKRVGNNIVEPQSF